MDIDQLREQISPLGIQSSQETFKKSKNSKRRRKSKGKLIDLTIESDFESGVEDSEEIPQQDNDHNK